MLTADALARLDSRLAAEKSEFDKDIAAVADRIARVQTSFELAVEDSMQAVPEQLQQVREDVSSLLEMRSEAIQDSISSSESEIAERLAEHVAALENLDARVLQGEAVDMTTKTMCEAEFGRLRNSLEELRNGQQEPALSLAARMDAVEKLASECDAAVAWATERYVADSEELGRIAQQAIAESGEVSALRSGLENLREIVDSNAGAATAASGADISALRSDLEVLSQHVDSNAAAADDSIVVVDRLC